MNNRLFLTSEEMFPALANKDNNLRYLEFIEVDELKEFIHKCYEHADIYSKTDYEYENMLAKVLIDHLIRRGLIDNSSHQNFIDVLLAAVFLHNVYFDEERIIPSLVEARHNFEEIAKEFMPEQVSEAIFDTIEGQLGDATPIKNLKPKPNSPGELFAECVFIVRNLYRWR